MTEDEFRNGPRPENVMHPAPPVTGYRALSQAEVDMMNAIKAVENDLVGLYVAIVKASATDPGAARWASLARSHLETGFMYLAKAIAKPTNGLGRA